MANIEPIDRAPVANAFRWLAINAILPTAFAFVWRIVWWIAGYRTADNTYWLISFWATTGILSAANLTCAWLANGAWRWVFVASSIISIVGAILVGNPSVTHLFLQLPFIVGVVWEGNAWFW